MEQWREIKDYCLLSQVEQLEPKFAKAFNTLYVVSKADKEGWKEEKVTNFKRFKSSNAIPGLNSLQAVRHPVEDAA